MTTTTSACPRCRNPIAPGSKFCPSCGNDISGVWSGSNPALTIAVEADPAVDTLGAMLSEATLGDYDVYGELGRGGMAAVYLGLDLALNRKVAIKTMLPELLQREGMVARFKREAQTAAALSHPHIIQIHTVKQSKQLVYFVMKFIEGRSLESVIVDKGRVPLPMAQTILGQVASALDYAHKKHVVHRDIKPANIMIDEDGWAIVTDFGIAKVQEAQNLTATGTAIGTPHYMSPEQFHNKAVTGASDQYSLGVVAYEMLAGKKPFDGATYAEIITQHLFEPVPDLSQSNPDVPPHVMDVIKKMMAKEASDRFPDLDTAIHALGAPASKKEGDVVRTQMISLAKSGPQKKIRMSVPMSPIPVQKTVAPPEPTVIEPKKARPRPKTEKAEGKKSGAGKWIGIAAVLLGLAAGGGYYVKVVNPSILGGGSAITPQGAPDSTQSIAQKPDTATQPAIAAVDSAAIRDSMRAALAKRREDSLSIVSAARKAFNDSVTRETRAQRRADSIANAKRLAAEASSSKQAPSGGGSGGGGLTPLNPTTPTNVVVEPPKPGTIDIASGTPNAYLYINGKIDGALSSRRTIEVPSGQVKITVRAQGCTDFDTTLTVLPGTVTKAGNKRAKCS